VTKTPKKIRLSAAGGQAIRDEEERKRQTFEQIGRFLFQFSQLEFSIKIVLARALNLSEEQFDIVTSTYDFRVLCVVTQKILALQLSEQTNDIKDYFKRCLALNDDRVRIAHGLWADGPQGMSARHVARTSLDANFYFENPDTLLKVVDEAEKLMQMVICVCGAGP
jgi:hypothetical protein